LGLIIHQSSAFARYSLAEATATNFKTVSDVEGLCTMDSRCVAIAYKAAHDPSGGAAVTYALYTDASTGAHACTADCSSTVWQSRRELITTTDGSTTNMTCKVKPASRPTTGSQEADTGAEEPLAGLDADPDPNNATTGFQSGLADLEETTLAEGVTMTAMPTADAEVDDVAWLGYASIIFFALVLFFVLFILFAPSERIGHLITAEHAKKITIVLDAIGIILAFAIMVCASVAVHKGGLVDDFIGDVGIALLLILPTLMLPYFAYEIYVVRHYHDDIKQLKCIVLLQGLLVLLLVSTIAVVLSWIAAVGELPAQVARSEGGSRWEGHALGGVMKQIEFSACMSYRTCCRDPHLATDDGDSTRTAPDTCSSVPGPKNWNVTTDGALNQGLLSILDASQPAFCAAIAGGARDDLQGISFDACTALEYEVGFGLQQCQEHFCYDGVVGAWPLRFATRRVIRNSFLCPIPACHHAIQSQSQSQSQSQATTNSSPDLSTPSAKTTWSPALCLSTSSSPCSSSASSSSASSSRPPPRRRTPSTTATMPPSRCTTSRTPCMASSTAWLASSTASNAASTASSTAPIAGQMGRASTKSWRRTTSEVKASNKGPASRRGCGVRHKLHRTSHIATFYDIYIKSKFLYIWLLHHLGSGMVLYCFWIR
jgi:hypothetical protein